MSLWQRARTLFARVERGNKIVSMETGTGALPSSRAATGSISFPRFNPDDLAGRKGLSIYAKMRLDEQVKAVVTFKRDAVLSRGWHFQWDEDVELPDAEKALRKRVFERIVNGMPGAFVDALNVISTGREFGFSMTEKIYGQVVVDGKTYAAVVDLLGRDPTSFNFYTDEFGVLQRCEQVASMRRVEIDLDKFIHYVHNPEFDRYFGRSELREAYRAWYFKEQFLKSWALYLEKLGGGMLVGKILPEHESSFREGSAALAALRNVVANARNSPGIVLPPGVDITATFPSGTDPYPEALRFHDLAIAKALLVPNLIGVSHTGQTGSYSQAQTQLESFAWTVKADADRLEATLNEQLFRDLGDQNWGDGMYPQFAFKPLTNEGLRWLVTTWGTLANQGAVIPTEADEARLREILEMPPRSEQDVTLVEIKQGLTPPAPPVVSANDAARKDTAPPAATPDPPAAKDADSRQAMRDARPSPLKFALERVDFAVIDRKQTTMAEAVSRDQAVNVAKAVQRLLTTDNLNRIAQNPSLIANVELQGADVGRIKVAWQKAIADAWALGRQHAQLEIRRTGRRFRSDRTPIEFADLRERAAQYFEANSFRMAGNVADGVRAVVQAELQNSVKYGRSPAQTRQAVWTRLVSKGFSSREAVRTVVEGTEDDTLIQRALDALDLDTDEQAAAYLDTLARTNLFESMNEARYAQFTDPALDGFVVALRYSAILDDRTTQICEHLHDKVFNTSSDVWNEYRPPNHWNCRSVLVPVTQLDLQEGEWNGEESSKPTVEPQEGFK
jgi:SPP1 gp7 family putative phage head morphogenesis protein